MFYCFPWITFMARDFISTLRLTPSKLWELTQWWKGDSPLTLWCKPNWESKSCKDQINLPVARIDCQTDRQKRIQFTTNWWMVLHFAPHTAYMIFVSAWKSIICQQFRWPIELKKKRFSIRAPKWLLTQISIFFFILNSRHLSKMWNVS